MHGMPKHLNTAEDVRNIVALARQGRLPKYRVWAALLVLFLYDPERERLEMSRAEVQALMEELWHGK